MYANLEQEQVAMDHHHQFPMGPQPTKFHEVVHKIYHALSLWPGLQRCGISFQPTANMINFLSLEPLVRTATDIAMHEDFHGVMEIVRILLELHDELEPNGLSLQGIRYLYHVLLEGLVTRAALGPHSKPTAHPKQPETTATAVVGPNNKTYDMKHTTPPNTTATAVVDSNSKTHDTKHTTPPNTTATAVVGPNNKTYDMKHTTPPNTTATAVVDSNSKTHDTKHTTPPNTTATAVVESGVTLSEDEVDALVTADLEAEMNRFRYTKEAKQWIDIKEEPECSLEVERDSRLRQYFNVVAPGPNADK